MKLKPGRYPDPLKYCKQFKEKGCCHVDGFLCDVKNCEGSGYKNEFTK